jgi:alpha-methylacyl-CoA racemase
LTDGTGRAGPLVGVRVVEMGGQGAAPFCALMLSDMGADVIRIDRPLAGPVPVHPMDTDIITRGRGSVAIDLKHPDGAEVVRRLTDQSDVMIEGFRPGVMERLGLGPDECRARNAGLVYARMSGFGQDGPLAPAAGHDLNYLATAGVLGAIGPAGGPPVHPLNLIGDFGGGGVLLAFAVAAALLERARSGQGQVIDCAMTEGAAYVMTANLGPMQMGWWTPERGTNLLDGGAHFYNTYETADGRFVTFGSIEPPFYAAMLEGLGLAGEDLPDQMDEAHWPDMRRRVAERVRTRTRDEWVEAFAALDACFAPVLAPLEAPDHPHHVARGTYTEVGGLTQVAPVPRFSRTPGRLARSGSHPGQETEALLTAWGFDRETLQDLLDRGVVQQSERR